MVEDTAERRPPIRREWLRKKLVRATQLRMLVTMTASVPALFIAVAIFGDIGESEGVGPLVVIFGFPLVVAWLLTRHH